MKSAVESLSPTRVRLTVEVPFDELKPSVDAAYKKVAGQVRIRGFRPGKVPPRILDQHVGRGAILQEAVQAVLPELYGQAVQDNGVDVLGHPDLQVTGFADGDQLAFTAEVDVRPQLDLPDYEGLPVTVDDATVTEERVEEQLGQLRDRFAVLTAAERPAATGDYVMIDLKAAVDGEDVADAAATGLSYEVGSAGLVPGLDEALEGLAEGESRTFATALRAGEHAGREAEVTVTVHSVKAKELPPLDDDFAQTASEFDTIEELRADIRGRLERMSRLEQAVQARDRVLQVLLERVEVPIPEHVLGDELAWRRQALDRQLAQAGLRREDYLASLGKTEEDLDAETEQAAREAIRAQFVLDAIAAKEEFSVTETDLSERIVMRAQQAGVPPEQMLQQIVQSGQVPMLAGEVLRTKALATLLEHAKITDESGNEVDLDSLEVDGADAEPDAESDTEPDAESDSERDAESDSEPGSTGPAGSPES